jgi:hypothetical protein
MTGYVVINDAVYKFKLPNPTSIFMTLTILFSIIILLLKEFLDSCFLS